MTMNWLYLYETYPVLSARWKYSENTIGDKVIDYATKMYKVALQMIKFGLKCRRRFGRTVDCCTFTVQEMRQDPSSEWFDYKSHSCGLVSILVCV